MLYRGDYFRLVRIIIINLTDMLREIQRIEQTDSQTFNVLEDDTICDHSGDRAS
jgi:hypothetical protein